MSSKGVVIKKGDKVWFYISNSNYSSFKDADSCIEVFNNKSGMVVIGAFNHMGDIETGLPSLFYFLDHNGNWNLNTFDHVKRG